MGADLLSNLLGDVETYNVIGVSVGRPRLTKHFGKIFLEPLPQTRIGKIFRSVHLVQKLQKIGFALLAGHVPLIEDCLPIKTFRVHAL